MRQAALALILLFSLAGCSDGSAPSSPTPVSASSLTPAPTPTPGPLSLKDSCTSLGPYLDEALALGSEEDQSESSMAAGQLARVFRIEFKDAPRILALDLQILSDNLEKVSVGTIVQIADLVEPTSRLISACGPDPAPSKTPPKPVAPTFSKAERKYLKTQDVRVKDKHEAKDALETGRAVCKRTAAHSAGWSRSRYLFDRENDSYDADDAVKSLCTRYAADLRIAHRTIFFEKNNVGTGADDVRPGTYRTAPKVSDCYWSRLTNSGKIIANDFSDYAPHGLTVTVYSSDGGFTYNGECTFYPTAKP